MKNNNVSISAEKLQSLLDYVKNNQDPAREKIEFQNDIQLLQNLINENTVLNTIQNRVKTAILIAKGKKNPNPNRLLDTTDMSDLELSDIQYMCLVDYLNEIIHETNKNERLYLSELMRYSVVKECIEAVAKKGNLNI